MQFTPGTVFRHRYRNRWEYGVVAPAGNHGFLWASLGNLAPHDVVTCLEVVWKKDEPIVKRIVVLKPSDRWESAAAEDKAQVWWGRNPRFK